MATLECPIIFEVLKRQLDKGTITIQKACEELYKYGWFNYVPSDTEAVALIEKNTTQTI